MTGKHNNHNTRPKSDQSTAGYSFSDQLYIDIVKTYLATESVKETAARLNTSAVKVRKVLITEGLWSSKTSLEIQRCLSQGKTTAEIAEILSTTEKAVQQYLPYTRGIYHGDQQSVSALNSADYRNRIRVLQEKILQRSMDGAMEDKWNTSAADIEGIQRKGENKPLMLSKTGRYPGALLLPEGADVSKLHHHIRPIRLHMELMRDDSSQAEEVKTTYVLQTYGQVTYGDTISRDVIVPDDMPLWALHYTIQKCFGWQNSHLHRFELPQGQFERITDGNLGKYMELTGVVFRSPWMDENEGFWNDDYESGSFKTWIRRKYSGPYVSLCHGEGIWQCRQDAKKRESGEVYAFNDIPIQAAWYISEGSCTQLLERLTVGGIFALHDRGIDDKLVASSFIPQCFEDVMNEELQREIEECLRYDSYAMQPKIRPLTDTLYYNYDFGDNWHVRVTASLGAADLLENGRVSQEELEQAVLLLMEKYRPVCIAQDGCFVLDDVGGMDGFVQFLKGINQPDKGKAAVEEWRTEDADDEDYGPYEDKKASIEWAKSLGWSGRKITNKNLL